MPRIARLKTESGYYHIMKRGNERRNIFTEDDDRRHYLSLLSRQVQKGNIEVLAYCLMDNHVHLLLKDPEEGLIAAMRSIGTAYAVYFNEKYCRSGHLFQNRYKSEPIDDESYLFAALRYIHQNPVKAGMCQSAAAYQWSSDCYYRNPSTNTFVNTDILLAVAKDKEKAVTEYSKLMEMPELHSFADLEPPRLSQQETGQLLRLELNKAGLDDSGELWKKENREKLGQVLTSLHREYGISGQKLAIELGTSKATVQRLLQKKA